MPLETYVAKFTNMRFEPAGMTDDPDIRIAAVGDGLHLPPPGAGLPAVEKRAELGIFTAEERAAQVAGSYGTSAATPTVTEEEDVDLEALRGSAPIEAARPRPRSPEAPKPVKEAHSSAELLELVTGHGRRRAAVHDLRHEDAPGRQLLRLRGLRLHQRLQLMAGSPGCPAARGDIPGGARRMTRS